MGKKSFTRNILFALIAQVVSLLSSFAVQFFAPKALDVTQYAYWQLFLFYVSYINISRIGIIDGMYLRLGGKERKDLDTSLIKSEYIIFMILQFVFAIGFVCVAANLIKDENRLFVILTCAICMVVINSNNYFGFLFQAINETDLYSISEIIYNLTWFIAVFILCFFKFGSYKLIIYMYILGQFLAATYLMRKAGFIFEGKLISFKNVIGDMYINAKCGISLLIAMYASMLITGIARVVVDGKWGIEMFGYFSFAMSLTTFLLKFISQISMVLFPAIRKVSKTTQKTIFEESNTVLTIILPMALLLLLPMKYFVNWWLPQYNSSMFYLSVLLPICVFDGKMQLLYSTFLKVINKQSFLLIVNIIAVTISFLISILGAYIVNDLNTIAWAMLIAIATRSIISGIAVSCWLGIKHSFKLQFTEIIVIFAFSIFNTFLDSKIAFVAYFSLYILYLVFNYKDVYRMRFFLKRMNRQK